MADKKSKAPFYLIDTNSQFYKPLGTRLAICLSVIVWAALETWHRDPFWSVISLACAAYCVYVLFWTYKPPTDPLPPTPAEEADEQDVAAMVEGKTGEAGDEGKPNL